MEYLLKKAMIKKELRKIDNGHYNSENEHDINRARFLSEIREIYYQTQLRGMGYGLFLSVLTLYKFKFYESIFFRLAMMYTGREVTLIYYINEFYCNLELSDNNII